MKTLNDTMELGMNDLEIISGGTVGEFEDLFEALSSKTSSNSGMAVLFGSHFPGANNGLAALVEECLDKMYGITADIDLGFCGTGIGSEPNKYTDKATGRSLTHKEVMERILG